MIPPPSPRSLIAGGEQRFDFAVAEVGDQSPVATLRWDRQDTRDALGVFGMLKGSELEQ